MGELWARLLRPFDRRDRAEQVVGVYVAPVAFGLVNGIVLRHAVAAYLVLQLIALVGGALAGYEHRTVRAGALRGVIGGALFGLYVLAGYAISHGGHLGHDASAAIPVVDAIAGTLLGVIFAFVRARRTAA